MSVESGTQLVHFSQLELAMPFLKYFESIGVDTRRYLAGAGFKDALLDTESNPVPVRLFFNVINRICRDYAIEDPGLVVGRITSLYMLGNFGFQLMSMGTIRGYLENGCRTISTRATGDHYWLVEKPEEVQFCLAISGLDEDDKIQNYLYVMFITINTIRQVLGKNWCPRQFTIPRMSTSTASAVSAILPETVVSRRGKYAHFTIPSTALSASMPHKTAISPQYLIASGSYRTPVDFIDSISRLVGTLVLTGRVDIAIAAQATGMSQRKLQRKLSAYGTTYSTLVAENRIALAGRWILESKGSMADIAELLGYNSPANFSRAFRRINGVSPTQFKRRSRAT